MASHEVITALLMRERFGIGQEVHVSILSTALYMLYCNVLIYFLGGFEAHGINGQQNIHLEIITNVLMAAGLS